MGASSQYSFWRPATCHGLARLKSLSRGGLGIDPAAFVKAAGSMVNAAKRAENRLFWLNGR
jgi:hypothetical protein